METPRHGYRKDARPQRMHNDIAQMFIELGVVAGLIWVTLFIFPLYAGVKIMRSKASSHEKFFTSMLLFSVAGLSVNALGDFPLQMPTGALLLWILWGILLALYTMNVPHTKPAKTIALPKVLSAVFALCFLVTAFWYADSMYQRSKAAWDLKIGMFMLKTGQINERTLNAIESSYKRYPYNPRTIEHLGLVQTVYYTRNQPNAVPYSLIISSLEKHLKEDPYGAGNLINYAAVNLNRAQHLQKLGDTERAVTHIKNAEEAFITLLNVLPFHEDTYSTGGLVYLLQGQLHKANALYQKALEIDPRDKASLQGLNATRIQALQTATPIDGLKGATISLPMEMLQKKQ